MSLFSSVLLLITSQIICCVSIFGSLVKVTSFSFSISSYNSISTNSFNVRNPRINGFGKKLQAKSGSVDETKTNDEKKKVVVIGAGWGGLSTAHALSKDNMEWDVTVVDAAPRPGGLVRDGFLSQNKTRVAEAGMHGFWDCYSNIFSLLFDDLQLDDKEILSGYAEQGQYSPAGLEAVWPVYRDKQKLPTGLGQALYTKFLNLSPFDLASALPLVAAFSEFDDSEESWEKYDDVSFRDLCVKLGVTKRCYYEAFESMILTGLFAPGCECSAAAALGMAYFFVLRSQTAFDVRWSRGNIAETIFDPWVDRMKVNNVHFELNSRVVGFNQGENDALNSIECVNTMNGERKTIEADAIVLAVGAKALNIFVRNSPELAKYEEFRKFSNLRGTSVLATRIYLDKIVPTTYSANACWGFDEDVGMTWFDIGRIYGTDSPAVADTKGSVFEVDFYNADSILVMDEDAIVSKVKGYLDNILGDAARNAEVVDAAVIKLPEAVNWYFPGSYKSMPSVKSGSISNLYFAGDIVKTRHGSWSQEKAYVTGIEAANMIKGKSVTENIIPLPSDEPHVSAGRIASSILRSTLGGGNTKNGPSLVDFLS